MNSFRETFYDLMRAQKAGNGNWTKSFTWRQVMNIYDEAAKTVGLTEMPGCVAHGFCPGCVQDENDKRLGDLEVKLAEVEDGSERPETRDRGSTDSGDPRTS